MPLLAPLSPPSSVYLEPLDDVVIKVSDITMPEQLKHLMAAKHAAITTTNVKLWKTLKAWIDVLSRLNLSQLWLHLTIAEISPDFPLRALLTDGGHAADRQIPVRRNNSSGGASGYLDRARISQENADYIAAVGHWPPETGEKLIPSDWPARSWGWLPSDVIIRMRG
ncbi:hypothetical protein [Sinorhizobium mexicanum]|uniref:Uncharacterized protein n=1 Tax=Sinorhizobium mexicanum TaxID=375549 RepID=A0A859QG78_9HYPH|nr:hypothetical protein [Sinorhizobium mexicanum]MBP1885125.1 hypothetical protein [Sinorhizobium mexicanum]QLL64382.1 hypothetical protein FKV68_23420 [Sinorhizobium mexicanum]